MLNCYNRGCGQKFDPEKNDEKSCRHHPGFPVFHDAYKGWGCCNKKCTDFTEFLNIQGCTLSKHSNEKPIEPPKPVVNNSADEIEIVKIPEPIKKPIVKERPPFDAPLINLEPTIAASLLEQVNAVQHTIKDESGSELAVGTICKNGGCNASYDGPSSDNTICTHHPGGPVFHEGLKFWSCCQKRTSDFTAFLSQVGCQQGTHKWKKEESDSTAVQCRWDWHQTPTNVFIAVYAKQYNPHKSFVKLNRIRCQINLVFPLQGNASFQLDMELRGIVDVEKSSVSMMGTKVEVKLVKAEPGTWSKIDFPREQAKVEEKPKIIEKESTPPSDCVDLSDIDVLPTIGSVNISEL